MLYYFHSGLRQGLFGTSDYSVVNEWNSHGILEPVLVNAVNNETGCRLNQFFLLSIMTRSAPPRLSASPGSVSLGPGKRSLFPYSATPSCSPQPILRLRDRCSHIRRLLHLRESPFQGKQIGRAHV